MNDITELAQSLKAAAEKATPGGWGVFQYYGGRSGISGGHNAEIMVCEHISKERPQDAVFIALANPANILALVEALEKSRAREIRWLAVSEEQSKIITDLESRTVTVKLPPRVDSSNVPFAAHTWNCCLTEVEKRLTGAGIKVEAE